MNPELKRPLCTGLLAHVDAGKTTLSEALLYLGGSLRAVGRVDHRNAFLDTDVLERERGITIFSKQAIFTTGNTEVTLLDTPGHTDFSSEMERTLQVLDCAILVISGTDGVQAHTVTLWSLLSRYHIPTLIFVNKMDLPTAGRDAILEQLRRELDANICDGLDTEQCAMCSEELMNEFLEDGALSDAACAKAVMGRQMFPVWFGSALKLDGIEPLMEGLRRWTACKKAAPADFAARVYKIAWDAQGNRLTFLKVTGGTLNVKQTITSTDGAWTEKVHQIRRYSGEKFATPTAVPAGTVVAVTGLTQTKVGEGLGAEPSAEAPALQPALSYRLIIEDGTDDQTAMQKLRRLEEEDPTLHIVWNDQLRQIHIQLMGEVQMEILQRRIADDLHMTVSFGEGSVVYRETVAAPVIGIGHYEPLRHYAETHILIEPLPQGSGIELATACDTDSLALNWQRLILTHLAERTHPGVLTGSPLTDVRITLLAGRAHLKHTEGGDFRQATYRAVRQGLRSAKNILLEPQYRFRLSVPQDAVGRAMTDLQRRDAELQPMRTEGDRAILDGTAPVAKLRDYAREVAAFTHGRGSLSCTMAGYIPCKEQEKIVAEIGYDVDGDVANSADSVFCAHGAGFMVPWNEVPAHAHVGSGIRLNEDGTETEPTTVRRNSAYSGSAAEDKELQAIFERTYGAIRRSDFLPRKEKPIADTTAMIRSMPMAENFLLVDGYNMIFAWPELKKLADEDLELARQTLIRILTNYQGFRSGNLILVFDAYKVSGGKEKIEKHNGIYVVYTKQAQLADTYIERVTSSLGRYYNVRVATSDGLEQIITLAHGALRISANAFREEVIQTDKEIAAFLKKLTAER